MTKHRRYSRKRGQRRNRRASRKMRGGENLTREQFNDELHTFLQSKNRDTGDDGSVVGDIDEFDEPEPIPIGGKRRRITKRKTNKKKTKKNNNRKTLKHRKRRYSGGADNFRMTTENNISPYDNQNDKDTAVTLAKKLR